MKDITTSFEEFKKQNKNNNLSSDITALAKLDTGEYEPIDGNVDIIQILDIVKDEDEIKKIEQTLKENFFLDTSLTVKDIKRGDKLYLTAMLQKTGSNQTISTQNIGIICVRVVDVYTGISKLTSLMKNKN